MAITDCDPNSELAPRGGEGGSGGDGGSVFLRATSRQLAIFRGSLKRITTSKNGDSYLLA